MNQTQPLRGRQMEQKIVDVVYPQLGFGGLLLVVLIAAFWKIHSDLAKLRVEMSHQLNRDLLSKRLAAYGDLWSRMEPTAIYTTSGFGLNEAIAFSGNLSTWYFSANGGLFLTSRTRDFYFSLQNLLRAVSHFPDWCCIERPAEPEKIFAQMLEEIAKQNNDMENAFSSFQEKKLEKIDSKQWSAMCKSVSEKLESFVSTANPQAGELIYVSIQQVSSVLRSTLTQEIHSRLDVEWPVA
jgi:hypothetical protein